mgnify:CR=1 FL=1
MDVHIAIEKLGKNNNQYTVKADGSGIDEWRSSEAQPTQSELDKAWSDYQTDQAAIKYKSDREKEYPSWEDQLDKIYHSGIDAWKVDIKAVKDKYPKP